jgi:hypothetical protein
MWMDADPLAAVDAPGPAIHHTHAKATIINKPVSATASRLENGSLMDIPARSYITLGYRNGEGFWRTRPCSLPAKKVIGRQSARPYRQNANRHRGPSQVQRPA